MGVDAEIENIYEGIAKINTTLFNMDTGLGGLLQNLELMLTKFDQKVNMVVSKVNGVQIDIVKIATKFPNEWLYLLLLLLVIVVLNVVAIYMLLHIYRFVLNRTDRLDEQRRWYQRNVFFVPEDRPDDLENIETPPPTYSEYIQTADLYARYHQRQPPKPARSAEPSLLSIPTLRSLRKGTSSKSSASEISRLI